MQFQIDKKQFLTALQSVEPTVSKRATLPILSGVRLEAVAGRAALSTTDLESAADLQVRAETSGGHGKAVVSFKELRQAVKAMPEGTVSVGFVHPDRTPQVTISSGGRKVTLDGFDPEDWPKVGDGIDWKCLFAVESSVLADAMGRAVLCASTDEARPVLTGALFAFSPENGSLEIVTTDSYRLGIVNVAVDKHGDAEAWKAIVPARVLRAITKILGKHDGQVRIYQGSAGNNNLIEFAFGAGRYILRCIDGEFPNYTQLVPAEEGGSLQFEPKEMTQAVKDASSIRSEKSTPARLILGDRCVLSVIENGSPKVRQALPSASYSSNGTGPLEVAFNPDFLADGIKFVGADKEVMWVKDACKPALIVGDPDRRYVVMPVRLPS